MKKEMMDFIICPVCKSKLTLNIDMEKDDEVITGSLKCSSCDHTYPVEDSIPNLLPPEK